MARTRHGVRPLGSPRPARRDMDGVASFESGIPDVLQARTKRGWRGIAEFQFEIVLFLLLLATFAAVRLQDTILIKTITLTPGSSLFVTRHLGDRPQGGNSTVAVDPRHPLHWRCDLRGPYAFP